ncbi:MAG: ribonuclease H-like domain-containing protein [Saprospiraceae bacterium]
MARSFASPGALHRDKDGRLRVRLKSFAGADEAALLRDFNQLLGQYYNDPFKFFLCGHNIKEFDIPYICRRMVVHSLPFTKMLDVRGKKPWETKQLLDTMELWSFGTTESIYILKLLAATLIPLPKDDIDGSMVGRVFWDDNDIDRIALYCEKDVLATVQLFLRYQLAPLLEADQVDHVGR